MNLVGKCIVVPDYWGKNSISTLSSKKKKKIKYVTYISNHVLVVLQNLLHLIKKISKEEGVFNIPILYMRAPKIRGINEVPSK